MGNGFQPGLSDIVASGGLAHPKLVLHRAHPDPDDPDKPLPLLTLLDKAKLQAEPEGGGGWDLFMFFLGWEGFFLSFFLSFFIYLFIYLFMILGGGVGRSTDICFSAFLAIFEQLAWLAYIQTGIARFP